MFINKSLFLLVIHKYYQKLMVWNVHINIWGTAVEERLLAMVSITERNVFRPSISIFDSE
jgi:hypothetical protein